MFVGDPPGLHEVNEDLLAFLKSRGAGTTTVGFDCGNPPQRPTPERTPPDRR